MAGIREKRFRSRDDLYQAVTELLAIQITKSFGKPHGVMLSGGKTPMPIYELLAGKRIKAAADFFLMYSDERMVPEASLESNYGSTRFLVQALGMAEESVLKVQTGLELKRAGEQYGAALGRFIKSGGRITVGLLGLGADGHTASLFSEKDVGAGVGSFAVGIRRAEKPDRVSVTPALLKRVETLIFVVVGVDKQKAVETLLKQPERCAAGMAVHEAKSVQLWTV
jgi:6-phosphogluconolactonase